MPSAEMMSAAEVTTFPLMSNILPHLPRLGKDLFIGACPKARCLQIAGSEARKPGLYGFSGLRIRLRFLAACTIASIASSKLFFEQTLVISA